MLPPQWEETLMLRGQFSSLQVPHPLAPARLGSRGTESRGTGWVRQRRRAGREGVSGQGEAAGGGLETASPKLRTQHTGILGGGETRTGRVKEEQEEEESPTRIT